MNLVGNLEHDLIMLIFGTISLMVVPMFISKVTCTFIHLGINVSTEL